MGTIYRANDGNVMKGTEVSPSCPQHVTSPCQGGAVEVMEYKSAGYSNK